MSNKHVTVSDLAEALKPLIEAMNVMRLEQLGGNSQVSEIHRIVTDTSVKLDAVDQNITTAASAPTRTTGKKLVGRKGAGDKKPTKRAAKKVAEPTGEDDAEEDADAPPAGEEDEEDTTPVKVGKAVKKTVKKPATKATTKPTKQTAKKAAATVTVPKKKLFNKMNFFKKEFESDETQFNDVLTKKLRNTIESENAEALKDLEGDALKRARANVYYHYLKDNKPEFLESLRAKFDAENAVEPDDTEEAEEADE